MTRSSATIVNDKRGLTEPLDPAVEQPLAPRSAELRSSSGDEPMSDAHGRLNGWKDISGALKRSVRTVQRWERDYGLPVHRQGPDGELIFAYPDELDAWVRAGRTRMQAATGGLPASTQATNGSDESGRVRFGPHCLLLDDRAFPLREGVTLIGRADDVDVQLLVPSVSRHHARIVVCGNDATLEDLDSHHGSWHGATRVSGTTRLASGDEIRLGTALLVYRFVRAAETTI